MIIKRKLYTKWDETDNLKRMKDSDILAEKKKKGGSSMAVVRDTAVGVVGGGALGAAAGAAYGLAKGGSGFAARMGAAEAGMQKAGKAGAILGGLALGAKALHKKAQEDNEAEFYNKRLKYAKKQAERREAKDWKTNMTQRDGYSY